MTERMFLIVWVKHDFIYITENRKRKFNHQAAYGQNFLTGAFTTGKITTIHFIEICIFHPCRHNNQLLLLLSLYLKHASITAQTTG